MDAIVKHIEQTYPTAKYSQVFYLGSQAFAGSQVVGKVFDNEGAVAIYLHYIYWVPTNSGATISFLDQNGLLIFSTIDNFNLQNSAPLQMIRAGQVLKITCNNAAIAFSIAFQYMIHHDGK